MRLFEEQDANKTYTGGHEGKIIQKSFSVFPYRIREYAKLCLFLDDAGDIKRNNEIGTIDSWGPLFSVSFDLIIHSYVKGKGKQGWASVLAFKGNGGTSHCCKHGDRIPEISLNKNGKLRVSNSVSGNKKYQFISNVGLKKWYNITVDQRQTNEKVNKKL